MRPAHESGPVDCIPIRIGSPGVGRWGLAGYGLWSSSPCTRSQAMTPRRRLPQAWIVMRALLSATSHSPVAEAEYAGSTVAQKNSPTSQATHFMVIGLHRLPLDLIRRAVRHIRFGMRSHECFTQARCWIDDQLRP